MTPRIATWRTLSKLRQRRIDALHKEKEGGQRVLREREAAHAEARGAQQVADANWLAQQGSLQRMLDGEDGFRAGAYLDRQAYAALLKERLDQAAAKTQGAARAEQAQQRELDALRLRIHRQTARLEGVKAQLEEALRTHEDLLQQAEEEEIAETATARRLMERAALSRGRA